MQPENFKAKSEYYLEKLCVEISDRSVASEGNRKATSFFQQITSSFGWNTRVQEFQAMDWIDGGATLRAGGESFDVFVSPYSLGCTITGRLLPISGIKELEQTTIKDAILLLHGDIAREQLMPKNFVFYNPEGHQRIISLLETGAPRAIICATGRNASLAGGLYPFPLIEDGDFNIPSIYMTESEGCRLLNHSGSNVHLESRSRRVPGKGCNVIASKGRQAGKRIVITAHIDAKKGTPGAIDNACGVVVLLLLAEMLRDYSGDICIELVPLNGEDYFAVPGQMLYLNELHDQFDQILLNINIDGAGYREGQTAFSFYGLSEEIKDDIVQEFNQFDGLTEGEQWLQGDHSIFIQNGRPAIAVSSKWFTDHIDNQDVTHTPKDNIEIVDCLKLVEIARVLVILVDFFNNRSNLNTHSI